MTLEQILEAVGGVVLTGVGSVTGWVLHQVLGLREAHVLTQAEVKALTDRLDGMGKAQVTTEQVRSVITQVLDQRDHASAERRAEWDRRVTLEIKSAVIEELRKHEQRCTAMLRRRPDDDPT